MFCPIDNRQFSISNSSGKIKEGKMIFKKYICWLNLLIIVLFDQTFSQSIGIVYEASSLNTNNSVYNVFTENPPKGMIKNIFFDYSGFLSESFQMSLRVGYGWNVYKMSYKGSGSETINEEDTYGIPFELDLKYQHYIEKDSVFEPLIGIGGGYYHYTTKDKSIYNDSSEEQKYITKGFSQYIIFGLNIHLSEKITNSIRFKKIMIHSISTKYEVASGSYEKDYVQPNGFNDLAISLGIFYTL